MYGQEVRSRGFSGLCVFLVSRSSASTREMVTRHPLSSHQQSTLPLHVLGPSQIGVCNPKSKSRDSKHLRAFLWEFFQPEFITASCFSPPFPSIHLTGETEMTGSLKVKLVALSETYFSPLPAPPSISLMYLSHPKLAYCPIFLPC
jgi:hypothetical protein